MFLVRRKKGLGCWLETVVLGSHFDIRVYQHIYSHNMYVYLPHLDILEFQVLDTPKSLVFVLTLDKALTNTTLKHCTGNSKLVQSRSNLIKVIKVSVKSFTHENCTAFRFRSSNCTNKMTYKTGRPIQRISLKRSRTFSFAIALRFHFKILQMFFFFVDQKTFHPP